MRRRPRVNVHIEHVSYDGFETKEVWQWDGCDRSTTDHRPGASN